jgi:hypothetical protein
MSVKDARKKVQPQTGKDAGYHLRAVVAGKYPDGWRVSPRITVMPSRTKGLVKVCTVSKAYLVPEADEEIREGFVDGWKLLLLGVVGAVVYAGKKRGWWLR